jgi:arylformamidase
LGRLEDRLPPQPPLPNREAKAYAARALLLSAGMPPAIEALPAQPYGPSPYQQVAIYRPHPLPAGPLAIVLYMHGGGWTNGYKEWVGLVARGLCPAPAIVAAVGYRLAPEARHPVPVEDCIAAAVHLRDIAGEIGGDPDRLILSGHSAGGQLCALMALRPEIAEPLGLPATAIRACLPVSGMFDLRDFVFGGELPPTLADAGAIADASPVDWTANAHCPFFIAWGGDDYPPIVRSNETFVERLRHAGADSSAVAYPGLDHYQVALAAADPGHDWCRRAAALIRGL